MTVALSSYRYSTRSDVKSLPPFTLTSTATVPVPDTLAGATHATMLDDTNCAPSPSSTSSPPKRQRRPASRKPEPVTLTMVPPNTVPRRGNSPDTAGIL